MPRKYVRKTQGPQYTREDLRRAVEDVVNKNKTYQEAEDHYGVPKASIFHRIKGRSIPVDKVGAGRPRVLSEEAEQNLELCIKARARMGYPCDREEVKSIVAQFVQGAQIKNPFTEGQPGNDWYYGFLKRHPSLSLKKPELLEKARKTARDPEVVYDFYNELKQVVIDCGLEDKNSFIFNTDESGFTTDPQRLKALGEKGKSLVRVTGGSGRTSISVLATICADGSFLPPFILFKGVAVQPRWISEKAYPGTLYTTSSNGWMEEPQFFEWFSNAFVEEVKNKRETLIMPNQTALLMYDGHNSHISYRIVKMAMDNNIQFYKFPSHLTDTIQPLDKCVFGPVKTAWAKKLIVFTKQQIGKNDFRLSRSKFVELLGLVWKESMNPDIIRKAFTSTGTFPVDSTKFPESHFNPIDLRKFKEKHNPKVCEQDKTQSILVENTNVPATTTNQLKHINESTEVMQLDSNDRESIPSTSSMSLNDVGQMTANVSSTVIVPSSKCLGKQKTPLKTPSKIIELFCQSIKGKNEKIETVKRKISSVPRLKAVKYGEVLTNEKVLEKMAITEEKKREKEAKKLSKVQRPKKEQVQGQGKGKKRKTVHLESDSENEDTACLYSESESEDSDFLQSCIQENIKEVEYEEPNWTKLKPGMFLLVDFLGGSRKTNHFKYVACIEKVDQEDGEIYVNCFRRVDTYSTSTTFTALDEPTTGIEFSSVIAILPDPKMKLEMRKLVYIFPGSVSVFEK